jgi:tellurium resistance protein TerZ
MSVNLQKGQKISLAKAEDRSLTKVFMGLGWDVARGASDIDLDASCLVFDQTKQLVDQVWFRQLKSKDKSIVHSGDNLTGEGEGDDEIIHVDLERLPSNVKSLVFTVNSFRGQDFSTVANAFCRLVDAAGRKELARFDLSGGGPHTGLIMAKVYLHNGEWKIHAIGEPGSGRTFKDMMPQISAFA